MAGAGAEVGHPLGLDQLPESVGVGKHRMPAVTDHGAPAQQARDAEVPHHPTQRGLPEEDVIGIEIGMQGGGFEVLEDHPAVAVHDALGRAGGAGGEQHPQRVVEGNRRHRRGDGFGHHSAIVLAVEQQQTRLARQ